MALNIVINIRSFFENDNSSVGEMSDDSFWYLLKTLSKSELLTTFSVSSSFSYHEMRAACDTIKLGCIDSSHLHLSGSLDEYLSDLNNIIRSKFNNTSVGNICFGKSIVNNNKNASFIYNSLNIMNDLILKKCLRQMNGDEWPLMEKKEELLSIISSILYITGSALGDSLPTAFGDFSIAIRDLYLAEQYSTKLNDENNYSLRVVLMSLHLLRASTQFLFSYHGLSGQPDNNKECRITELGYLIFTFTTLILVVDLIYNIRTQKNVNNPDSVDDNSNHTIPSVNEMV